MPSNPAAISGVAGLGSRALPAQRQLTCGRKARTRHLHESARVSVTHAPQRAARLQPISISGRYCGASELWTGPAIFLIVRHSRKLCLIGPRMKKPPGVAWRLSVDPAEILRPLPPTSAQPAHPHEAEGGDQDRGRFGNLGGEQLKLEQRPVAGIPPNAAP